MSLPWAKTEKSQTSLGIDERGGAVSVFGKDGISCKDGKRSISSAILGIGEHGGQVEVFGKGEGKAGMGINEYGNGVVASWDKNGYRRNNAKLKHWEEF